MSSRPAIWILCAGALIFACGHSRHNESAASTPDTRPAIPAPNARVLVASATATVDHGVHFALHITNVSDHAVELNFPSGQTHDFVVLDSLGREIWRWSDGRMFTQSLQNKLLGANETLTYNEHWAGDGRQGRFTAVALLKSSNHPAEQRLSFTLP